MTTITVVRKHNLVAIAADSLLTQAEVRFTPGEEKIFRHGDSFIVFSGDVSAMQAARRFLEDNTSHPGLFNIFSIREYWSDLHKYVVAEVGEATLQALVANPRGAFAIIGPWQIFEVKKFWALGSGQHFALGAMDFAYKSESLSSQSVAITGVSSGVEYDVYSGYPAVSYTVLVENSL